MNISDRRYLVDEDDEPGVRDYEGSRTESNSDFASARQTNTDEGGSEEPIKYTSQIAALLITVNVAIGAGLLALPHAMQMSGLVTSLIIQVIFLLGVVVTCIMSTELTVKTNVNSFHQLVKAHCHPYLYQFSQVSLLLLIFGTVIAFMVIVGDQSDRFFATVYGPTFCNKWYMNRRFIIVTATMSFIKPLCYAKTVDFLKYASFVGVASVGFIVYVVAAEFSKAESIAKDVNYLPKDWTSIGSILPVFCLAYQVHLSWVPTAATVRKEEKYTTYKTVTVAMVITTIVYMAVSVLALLTLGSKIEADLTESYADKSWGVIATVAIVALKCVLTVPPIFYPLRLSLIDILNQSSTRFSGFKESTKRFLVSAITLNMALILALVVPDVLIAVNVLGCLSVMFIFTLPALSYLNLIKENRRLKQQLAGMDTDVLVYTMKDKFKLAISYFFIVFGLSMTVLVLYKSIDGLATKNNSPPLCHPV